MKNMLVFNAMIFLVASLVAMQPEPTLPVQQTKTEAEKALEEAAGMQKTSFLGRLPRELREELKLFTSLPLFHSVANEPGVKNILHPVVVQYLGKRDISQLSNDEKIDLLFLIIDKGYFDSEFLTYEFSLFKSIFSSKEFAFLTNEPGQMDQFLYRFVDSWQPESIEEIKTLMNNKTISNLSEDEKLALLKRLINIFKGNSLILNILLALPAFASIAESGEKMGQLLREDARMSGNRDAELMSIKTAIRLGFPWLTWPKTAIAKNNDLYGTVKILFFHALNDRKTTNYEIENYLKAGISANSIYYHTKQPALLYVLDSFLPEDKKIAFIRLLLRYGADVNLPNKYGWTALETAKGMGINPEIRQMVEDAALRQKASF